MATACLSLSATRRGETGYFGRLYRIDALVNSGRTLVVSQIRLHPPRPRIARSCPAPCLAFRDPSTFELVDGQVLGLALDGAKAAGAEAAWDRQIARYLR